MLEDDIDRLTVMTVPQNPSENLDKITHLVHLLQRSPSLLEFETISLPFQLVEAGIGLWESTFSPEVLRMLSTQADADTLDAWAIALSQSLAAMLAVLNSWLPHLATLCVPPTLKEKISERIHTLSQIAREKSELLRSAACLLSQEEQLQHDAGELENLKQKVTELQAIEAELLSTDVEGLRSAIAKLTKALEPDRVALESLKQQKAQVDDQVAAMRRQLATLKDEISIAKHRQHRLDTNCIAIAAEVITLTQSQQERATIALSSVLADLASQREIYQETQLELQKAIEEFNQYQRETESIRDRLSAHYQSNLELGRQLPVDPQKVDALIRNIQQNLADIDKELAAGQRENERSRQKITLTF